MKQLCWTVGLGVCAGWLAQRASLTSIQPQWPLLKCLSFGWVRKPSFLQAQLWISGSSTCWLSRMEQLRSTAQRWCNWCSLRVKESSLLLLFSLCMLLAGRSQPGQMEHVNKHSEAS